MTLRDYATHALGILLCSLAIIVGFSVGFFCVVTVGDALNAHSDAEVRQAERAVDGATADFYRRLAEQRSDQLELLADRCPR